jgi:hypothetical protein
MRKYALLILLLIVSWTCLAWAESKLYVFGNAAVLSGFYVINKATGEKLGYVAIVDGTFEMTIELELVPVYLADPDPIPDPDPDPDLVPTKENAFETSCDNCHKTETEDKFRFINWDKRSTDWTNTINAPIDKGHKKHIDNEKPLACAACHRTI